MAWDKTKPTDQSKIRTYPTLLTDNFKAIEEGDQGLQFWQTRFDDRDVLGIASNPTRADDEMAIFSKSDGSNTEMFIMDDQDPANFIQITRSGQLGGVNTKLRGTSVRLSSTTFDKDNFVSAWGVIDSSANLVYGNNLAATHTRAGTGNYNITTTNVFNSANVAVVITCLTASSSPTVAMIDGTITLAANVVTIPIQCENRSGNNVNAGFHVAIFGGRP